MKGAGLDLLGAPIPTRIERGSSKNGVKLFERSLKHVIKGLLAAK